MKTLEWPFKIQVLAEAPTPSDPTSGKKTGPRPVVQWQPMDSSLVGDVSDELTGTELAVYCDNPELAKYGDERLTLIEVNNSYVPFRQYLDAVARSFGDQTVRSREERYLVGTAVALSRVLGMIPGSDKDPFPDITNDNRHDLVRLAADAVVAAFPPLEK